MTRVWLAGLLASCGLGGCAMLAPSDTSPGAPAAAAGVTATAPEPPAARPAAWAVSIEAPPALRDLLARHLDLVRMATLSSRDDISDGELQRLVDTAPAQATALLQTEGFFAASVRVEPVADGSDGRPHWRVTVDSGPQTRVQRLDVEFEGDLARALARDDPAAIALRTQLLEAWPLRAGRVLRNADWSDAKAALLTRVRAAGYATASFSGTTAQVDVPRQQARLFLVVDSGPLFQLGHIEVTGLQRQHTESVLNLAGFAPGDPVTESRLLDFQDRLAKSGLFEQAVVTLEAEPERAAAATVRVQLREQPRHQLVTGLGFSSNAGPRATLEHTDKRLFNRAATARNKFEWGRTRQAWDGEISTHVRADNYRWFTGGTIERLKTDTDVVLSQRVRLGRALESPRIERVQFAEIDRAVRRTAQARTVTEALTANQVWIWRDIDNPLLPTHGQTMSLALALGQARSTDAPSDALARVLGRLTLYRPLGANWYGQARFEAGQVFVRDAGLLTDNLGFRAGGDESVRGYAYRSLGPLRDGAVGSGKVMGTASVELARPLSRNLPNLWGAVFVDVGGAANTWTSLDPALGYGLGLRWRSPVGPLKLDLAYGQEVRRVRAHFSVGIVF